MSQPSNMATELSRLPCGTRHWTVHDDRLDFRSDSYAVRGAGGGWVAIDPLPLEEAGISELLPLEAICLTGAFHQRAAWDWKQRFDVEVWAPRGAQPLEGIADRWFDDGWHLPGRLIAQVGAGPSSPHAVFCSRDGDGLLGVFCGDLLMRANEGDWAPVPEDHRKDPPGLKVSIGRLKDLRPDRLYPAHGTPMPTGARDALATTWREMAGTQGFEPR